MTRLLFLLAFVLFFALSGCQSQQQGRQILVDTASLSSAALALDSRYPQAARDVLNHKRYFSKKERRELAQIKQDMDAVRADLHRLVKGSGGLAQVLVDINEVSRWYQQLKPAYLRVRAIVAPRLDKIPNNIRRQLLQFDRLAIEADSAVLSLKRAAASQDEQGQQLVQALQDVLTIGAATAKMLMVAGVL